MSTQQTPYARRQAWLAGLDSGASIMLPLPTDNGCMHARVLIQKATAKTLTVKFAGKKDRIRRVDGHVIGQPLCYIEQPCEA